MSITESITDQFWQYAGQAIILTAAAKTDEDRQSLLDLARTWTQAALVVRASAVDPNGLPEVITA